MKKIFYSVFILLLFSANIYAQRERLIIHEFSKTPQVSESDFNTAKNAIIAAFDASNRFEILNAEQQALIDQESKSRDEGNAIYSIDSNTGDIKTKSNRYALSAAVTACEITKKDYEGGSTFSCFFAYTVSIVDMEENSTVVTKTFKHSPPSAVGGAIETLLPGFGNAAGRIAGEANTPEKAKSNVFKRVVLVIYS